MLQFELDALNSITTDSGKAHAIAHSLSTHQKAKDWQLEQAGMSDNQGWWAVNQGELERASLLWLYNRAKDLPQTREDIKITIEKSLEWLKLKNFEIEEITEKLSNGEL